MIKFAVIIPFRPKAESVNWEIESALLQKTICSVLQQTYIGVEIFVVFNEQPLKQIIDNRVHYIKFPFGNETYDNISIRNELFEKFKSEQMVVRRWDKARKLTYGCKLAKEQGFHYVMALDADDLLSKHLFSKLAAASDKGQCPGWYMEKGYVYKPPTRYLIRVPKQMRFLNGSTHILRSDIIKVPDFNSTDWQDFNLFTDHGWVKDRLKKYINVELKPVDHAMLVYVVHQSNISKIDSKEYGSGIKKIIKRIIRFVPLTKRLREEFSIVSLVLVIGLLLFFI